MTSPSSAHVRLAEATSHDVDDIAVLDGLSPGSRRLLRHELARPDRCCLVARAGSNGAVVGYAAALEQAGDAHVLDVAVARPWRRRGVATRLLIELSRRMAARGAPSLTLEVRADNDAARALYRRLGFLVEGRRPGYYTDGEDALILWRRASPPLVREGG